MIKTLRQNLCNRKVRWLLLLTLCLLLPSFPALGAPRKTQKQSIPALQIVAPEPGCSFNTGEKIQIQVLVRRDIAASSIQVMCNGRGIGLLNKAPFLVHWDTAGLKAGTYQVQASAYLASGQRLSAVPVEVHLKGELVGVPENAVLMDGMPVILATEEFMKSGETHTGTAVRLKVERDVLSQDGRVLIPLGATALGEVLRSEGHGLFGKAGKLDFALRSVTAADGTPVPLRAVRNHSGDSTTAPVIVGAVLINPLILLFNGPNVEIPAGTVVTAFVDKNTPIAKPLPARADAKLNITRTASITAPQPGEKLEKSDTITFACAITPADDNAYIRLYLNGRVIINQKGSCGKIEWKGARATKNGEYTLEAEVTFSTGHIVKAPAIKFNLGDS